MEPASGENMCTSGKTIYKQTHMQGKQFINKHTSEEIYKQTHIRKNNS